MSFSVDMIDGEEVVTLQDLIPGLEARGTAELEDGCEEWVQTVDEDGEVQFTINPEAFCTTVVIEAAREDDDRTFQFTKSGARFL